MNRRARFAVDPRKSVRSLMILSSLVLGVVGCTSKQPSADRTPAKKESGKEGVNPATSGANTTVEQTPTQPSVNSSEQSVTSSGPNASIQSTSTGPMVQQPAKPPMTAPAQQAPAVPSNNQAAGPSTNNNISSNSNSNINNSSVVLPSQQNSAPQAQSSIIANDPATQPSNNSPAPAVTREGSMLVPVTAFSNMASGYQATNPGFRAILKDSAGKIIGAGPMTIDAVMNGYRDDASAGSAYGRTILSVDLAYIDASIKSGAADGVKSGSLSICMAKDEQAAFDASDCKSLSGNIHPERPFQWINKKVDYQVKDGRVEITKYYGDNGEGGTSRQIALAAYHPAYGFATPGKAFKDYQSPLVFDLNHNGKFDLTDVWNESLDIRFDLMAEGKAVRTGWVAKEDAFLAMDISGNGKIDSGAELFGEYSKGGKVDEMGRHFENGFLALAQYDSNKDGKIDSKDVIFSKLLVWRDLNQNGMSEKNELMSLKQAKIKEISLAYESTESAGKPLTVLDHEVRLVATFKTVDKKVGKIGDVWFKQRRNIATASN